MSRGNFTPNLFEYHRIYTIEDVLEEREAIQKLKQGNINGLEFLVWRFQVKAIRTAFLITRDLGLAEDVVQESFIRAYRSIHRFDETRPFEPWFLRSVVNASLKMMYKRGKQVEVRSDAGEDGWEQFLASDESVETQVESAEFQGQLWDAMQTLSPRQRAVVVQRYYLGLSEQEMAAQAGVARGTVKWLLNAARGRLRALLADRSAE